MLENKMKSIKDYLQTIQNFFQEDAHTKKEVYLNKLETFLGLTIQFFKKYGNQDQYMYSYYDYKYSQTVYLIVFLNISDSNWQLNYENKLKSLSENISTQELTKYCWENQMDIKSLIEGLFEFIKNFFAQKLKVVNAEKDKYNAEINCLDEGINNLQELLDMEISEEIKKK